MKISKIIYTNPLILFIKQAFFQSLFAISKIKNDIHNYCAYFLLFSISLHRTSLSSIFFAQLSNVVKVFMHNCAKPPKIYDISTFFMCIITCICCESSYA